MPRDFHLPGRSPVIATEGMAATSHPLATLAAIDMLRAGGNAADAAVAAIAVMCVAEPHMTGIGGDCFCMVAPPGKPVWGYNGSGRSGAAANIEPLRAQGALSIPSDSIHSVTVPGAADAWEAILKAHGRFGLDRVLQPAIHYAENGFPIAARVASDWPDWISKLNTTAGGAKHYLPGGKPPAEGDVIKLAALAQTLKAVAAKGSRAIYEGEIAEDIVKTVRERGSFLTVEDFAAHRGEAVTPLSSDYRGNHVKELPPNGQGIVALLLLNILEDFDLASLDPLGAERFHLQLEAARMAFAARNAHVADPAHMRLPVETLLDKSFARKLAAKIDPRKRVRLPDAPTPGSDTVYMCVVDRDRMAVSIINSLYSGFGSGVCTEKTGIMLHNRGTGFSLDPASPNVFGPAKRPMHTIIPGMSFRNGKCDTAFGVMGADYQPMGHAHFMLNRADYGMDVQQAIDTPRIFFEGGKTVAEGGISQAAAEALAAMGHDMVRATKPFGGSQAIAIDWQRGTLTGGSDARKDGCALGY